MKAKLIILTIVLLSFPAHAKRSPFISTKGEAPNPQGAKNLCQRYPWSCSHSGLNNPGENLSMRTIKSANRQINRQYREITDKAQYGKEEHWALLTRRGGDCEDFALTKKKWLIENGAIPESLLVATVLDRQRNAHAVLVLLTDSGDYVLDNLTSRVVRWDKTGYFFLRIQNPDDPRKWEGVYTQGK